MRRASPHSRRLKMRHARPGAQVSFENAHPFVRRLIALCVEQQASILDVQERAGLCKNTFTRWKKEFNPAVVNFEAALNVLGYRLAIVPICDKECVTVPVSNITHTLRGREYCATPIVHLDRTQAP